MHLTRLAARDFRNLRSVTLHPHPRFNVLAGENGQGKTNLIESIYWVATLRPFRAARLRDLVRWGAVDARVEADVGESGLVHRLCAEVVEGERRSSREGKPARASDYFGALAVVLFTPDDVGLVRGAPADRRRHLDRCIFNTRPGYLTDAIEYRRNLDARNRLLREGADDLHLGAYEEALAVSAARIIRARCAYLDELRARFAEIVTAIGGGAWISTLAYRCSVDLSVGGAPGRGSSEPPTAEPSPDGSDGEEGEAAQGLEVAVEGIDPEAPDVSLGAGDELGPLVDRLASIWAQERPRDRLRGFTQRGPHADDLVFRLSGRVARGHASQGQQRALVLALKIAEIELLIERYGVHPVLLLDDVTSELDAGRNARLFELLGRFSGQVFITTTDAAYLEIDAQRSTWQVEAGLVAERNC